MFRVYFYFTFIAAPLGFAQTLSGVVVDDQNNPLASVNIGIRVLHRHTSTDQRGAYIFRNLPPGTYAVEFSHVGYKSEVRSIAASAGDDASNVTLRATPIEFRSITVTATTEPTDAFESAQPVSVVEDRLLDRTRGQSLMQSV